MAAPKAFGAAQNGELLPALFQQEECEARVFLSFQFALQFSCIGQGGDLQSGGQFKRHAQAPGGIVVAVTIASVRTPSVPSSRAKALRTLKRGSFP